MAILGTKLLEEIKKRISKSLMGHVVSLGTKEKIRQSHLNFWEGKRMDRKRKCLQCDKIFVMEFASEGKFCSRECCGLFRKGKKLSPLIVNKMKQSSNPGHFKKGIPSWNKGLKRWWNSPTEFKKGIVSTNKGKQLSKGVRERISNSMKGKHNMEYYKEMGIRGLLKQQNSKEPTSIEKKVYEELKNCGLLFEKQHLVNGKFLVDAYIPSLNLIIEADGDYWHSLDRVVKKDKAENAYLTKCGFNLLRFTETEINNGSFKERMVN